MNNIDLGLPEPDSKVGPGLMPHFINKLNVAFPTHDDKRAAALTLIDPRIEQPPSDQESLLDQDFMTLLWRSHAQEVNDVYTHVKSFSYRKTYTAGQPVAFIGGNEVTSASTGMVNVVFGSISDSRVDITYDYGAFARPVEEGGPKQVWAKGVQKLAVQGARKVSFDVVGSPEVVDIGDYNQPVTEIWVPMDASQRDYDRLRHVGVVPAYFGDNVATLMSALQEAGLETEIAA